MFKILDLYVGRTIIATTSLVLVVLVGLSGIIRFIEQLRNVGRGSYDLLQAFYFVMLGMPRDVELFFTMSVLLGALIGLGILASSSELVVMQAAGYSKLDIGLSVLKTAVPLMMVIMLLSEFGAPQAQKLARDIRSFAISGGQIVSVRSGVWARDANDFIFIGKVENDTLYGLNVWRFDDDKKLHQVIFSPQVAYQGDNQWLMQDAQITQMADKVAIGKTTADEFHWQSSLVPDKLEVVRVEPEELSISGLYDYTTYLKASEQDASRYELAFWRKVTQPFSIAVMMLMALSFVFGPLRSVSMGARVLSGVVAGFTFYISSEFFGPLTLVYGIPPMFGAIMPSVVFLGLALMLLRRKL